MAQLDDGRRRRRPRTSRRKDVTERKRRETEDDEAEQLIRHSEALHRTLTANLPDTTVFLLDHELRILIADGEAIRRLGFLDADDVPRPPGGRAVRRGPRRRCCSSASTNYRAALQRRAAHVRVHQRGADVRRPGGARARRDDGTIESLLVVARDVTERTRAAQQLARRARQQNAVAALGRFALESHDLGELMTEAVTDGDRDARRRRRPRPRARRGRRAPDPGRHRRHARRRRRRARRCRSA